ncbi:MAG: hypothetical protein IJG50_03405 [Clostridia bacterium]|nr:hypothetical protein [Clostridia bacterium]
MKSRMHKLLGLLLALFMLAGLLPATALAADKIKDASVMLDVPVAGMSPDYTPEFPDGSHYYAKNYQPGNAYYQNGIHWRDETANKSLMPGKGDVFKAGHRYSVIIELWAETGYELTGATHPIVNGEQADGIMTSLGYYKLTYTFTSVKDPLIDCVSVKLDAPNAGKRPDYTAEFPPGAVYYSDTYSSGIYKNDIMWSDVTSGTTYLSIDSGVFQAGRRYEVTVYLTAQKGCRFSDSTEATVNGKPAEAHLQASGQLMVEYTFPLIEEITSVSVTLDAPVAGASPDYTAVLPGGSRCGLYNLFGTRNGIYWNDATGGGSITLNPDRDVFRDGKTYRVEVFLTADHGYGFTDRTEATVNGQPAQASRSADHLTEYLRVEYTFPALMSLDGSVSGNKITYTVTDAPSGAVLIAARYDGGKMTDVQTVYDPSTGTLTMKGSGTVYKMFLIDGTKGCPLCDAWKS